MRDMADSSNSSSSRTDLTRMCLSLDLDGAASNDDNSTQ